MNALHTLKTFNSLRNIFHECAETRVETPIMMDLSGVNFCLWKCMHGNDPYHFVHVQIFSWLKRTFMPPWKTGLCLACTWLMKYNDTFFSLTWAVHTCISLKPVFHGGRNVHISAS